MQRSASPLATKPADVGGWASDFESIRSIIQLLERISGRRSVASCSRVHKGDAALGPQEAFA